MEFAWEQTPTVRYCPDNGHVEVLDQTRLPFEVVYVALTSVEDCRRAISDMLIRGAPLIGVVAAWGVVLAMTDDASNTHLETAISTLMATRPTAVNLRWALEKIHRDLAVLPPDRRPDAALAGARAIESSENACCKAIGEHGAQWLRGRLPGDRRLNLLTHCNAGWLATGQWGTALAPIYAMAAAGVDVHVWVDETRPRNQGARLTAWELGRAGIAHTVIADNAAGHLMQHHAVDAVIVGSDRTTAHGDVCNKIGTYPKALAAADNHLPFLVALPASTIDWQLSDGVGSIPIEQRDARELTELTGPDADGVMRTIRACAPGSGAANYAFDVTPARLVTTLVTEHGCFGANPADLARLRSLVSE